jgi:D-sedoheptulose 7-phosphate isomerase
MFMLEQRIQQQFFDSADLKNQAAEMLSRPIADAVNAVLGCITAGGKLMLCGQGASQGSAQQFAAQFVGRFERERPGLAAVVLGSDSTVLRALLDDGDPTQALAKQVQALGMPGDVLMLLSSAAEAPALVAALQAAHQKDITVVALTGRDAGSLARQLAETDVQVAVPHDRAARIQEVHMLALHCICDAVDLQLMGEQEPG